MRPILFRILTSILILLPNFVLAQTSTILADSIVVQGNDRIIASGNVEYYADGIHLKASKIEYDGTEDRIFLQGPIILTQGDEITVLSESGELSSDLNDGLLKSARMVLDQQLQLAAVELHRVGGRYTQLFKTVASSCRVCNEASAPLWQIRAKSIIHDNETRFLYFRDAQLRLGNVPVIYIPRLRLPDPSLKRATGFLQPDIRLNTQLGTGIKLPYFVTMGDHADLTFTPYISPVTKTLELRFRKAFARGNLRFKGALTSDTLRPGEIRAYVFGQGQFTLANNFRLSFGIETTSDPSYLSEYGYSENDKLENSVGITRTREMDHFQTGITNFRTLRGAELGINDQLPNYQAELLYQRRFYPAGIGGQGSWALNFNGHSRESAQDVLGRDVLHLGGKLDWSRSTTFGPGIVGRVGLEMRADAYLIDQDSTYSPMIAFVTPGAELELRWPWAKTASDGADLILEPTVYLGWSKDFGALPPNSDSRIVEFDEGNLFKLSRFSGHDRTDPEPQVALGAKWTRIDKSGWSLGIAAGRVFHGKDPGVYTAASGLDGLNSDWLAAAQIKIRPGFSLTNRALIDDSFSLTKAESRLDWTVGNLKLASTYGWIIPDAQENRPDVVSQLTLDGQYRFQRHWLASTQYLYDFSAEKATKASLGLTYTNECISFGVSISRRFTSSSSVTPSTDVNFSVDLLGFGSGDAIARQSCTGL